MKTKRIISVVGFLPRAISELMVVLTGSALLCGGTKGWTAQTSSSPIALSSDDHLLWVVNPDNNSVSIFNVESDANLKLHEIPVGTEPRRLALTPDNKKLYVANMASASVYVINTTTYAVTKKISVGSEPFGCVVSPDGTRLYVANQSSDNVSVIDTTNDKVIRTIVGVGPKPSGLAILGDKLYVTQFLAQLRPGGLEGRDDGKEGKVTIISRATGAVLGTVTLNPLSDTGFDSNGSVLDSIAATDPPTFTFVTGCFPNLLESIVIRGNRAYLPNVGSSPNGPFRFNVNIQALLSVFDTDTDVDSGQTINMNKGVNFEPLGVKLFNTTPIAIAFKQGAPEGFAVAAGVDRLVRVELDGTGTPTINPPTGPGAPSGVVRITVGENPQGIVINSTDTRAYVFNYISRDVSVVDIDSGSSQNLTEIARMASAALPAAGTLEAIIHHGKGLFNSSIGPSGTGDSAPPAGRLSDLGWGNCYNCHPRGLADGVTWLFPDGPRQTISMESTGVHPQPVDPPSLNTNGAPDLPDFKQRVLNWSAVRDEVQDFELNIRAVSGGQGLITDGAAVVNLTPTANTGRSADLDALAAYVVLGVRAPIAPKFNVVNPKGRELFATANCQSCHGGPNWTRSVVDFTPPPISPPEPIVGGQLTRFLKNVGTFDSTAPNELRGAGTNILTANGVLGFNVPSLLSIFASAPYLHSGSTPTLEAVLENVTHRSAGTAGVDLLSNESDRKLLVRFLKTIDASTPPFP